MPILAGTRRHDVGAGGRLTAGEAAAAGLPSARASKPRGPIGPLGPSRRREVAGREFAEKRNRGKTERKGRGGEGKEGEDG